MINKNIVLCVTGGIAAYKACVLASSLVKEGANVKVAMTENATRFVAPLTFETLTKNEVVSDTFDRTTPFNVKHVSLAKFADLIIVAPATANIIGKYANGIADDFVSTFLLAATVPVFIAPAMNTAMYDNPAVQKNISVLKERGVRFIEPGTGMLACGDIGKGRMSEPENIIAFIAASAGVSDDLAGKKIIVTAGPTRERIDDVRFISNRSTGKMGYEIARAARDRGASVCLVSGPVALTPPDGVELVPVESAADMYREVMSRFDSSDIVIKAAAVADYTPDTKVDGKIKKSGNMHLELVRTADILKSLGERKKHQILVGFAAEMQDLEDNAEAKLINKNADIICANDVSRNDIGFGSDDNSIVMFLKGNKRIFIDKQSKYEIANRILDETVRIMSTENQ